MFLGRERMNPLYISMADHCVTFWMVSYIKLLISLHDLTLLRKYLCQKPGSGRDFRNSKGDWCRGCLRNSV